MNTFPRVARPLVVRIEMNYADEQLDIEVPENRMLAVADFNEVPGVSDEKAEIERALDNPIGHQGVNSLSSKGKKTVVLVDDATRPTPAYRILPLLLDRLNGAGIEDRHIIVMAAVGTHRMMNGREMKEKIGEETLRRVSVVSHYWKNKEMLVDMGKTPSGVPLSVNRRYVEADIKIGIGHIAPHTQAGWTGGAKIVQPGVCGRETTDYTHWLSAKYDLRDLMGVADNPFRLEVESVVSKIGLDFIVNVVLNKEEEIVKAVAGDFVKAHRAGVQEAKKIYCSPVTTPADVVVCDAYPSCYGLDIWQTDKAVMASYLPIKKGGTIILLAPLPEGVSSEHPELAKFGHKPYAHMKKLVESGEMTDINAAAASSQVGQVLADDIRVLLYTTGLTKQETESIDYVYAENPQNAVDETLKRYDGNSKVLFLKNACEILPTLQTNNA